YQRWMVCDWCCKSCRWWSSVGLCCMSYWHTMVLDVLKEAVITHRMGPRAKRTATRSSPCRQSWPKAVRRPLYMLAHPLQDPRHAEVDVADGADEDEDDHRHRRGQAVVGARAPLKGQPVGVGDEDVRRPRRGPRAGDGRPALGDQVDHVEVVEVEREGADEKRRHRDHEEGQGDVAELLPARRPVAVGRLVQL